MKHLDVQTAQRLFRRLLDAATQERWFAHLRTCARCRALVQSERSLSTLLDLDGAPAGEPRDLHVAQLLERAGLDSGARRRRLISAGLAGLSTLVLAVVLKFQLDRLFQPPTVTSHVSPVDPVLGAEVTAHLDALDQLRRDPWIADQLTAVAALRDLIAAQPEPAP